MKIKIPINGIFQSFVNNFYYLTSDADFLYQLSKREDLSKTFERTKLCRTAIVLYVISIEGLINKMLDHLLEKDLRRFVLEREEIFSYIDKFEILPLLHNIGGEFKINKANYPWGHLKELYSIRNDFVHPKHDRVVFYKAIANGQFDRLNPSELPKDLYYFDSFREKKKVKVKHLIYSMTRIPKDPYSILPEHVEAVRKVVFDIVDEVDKMVDGKIKKGNLHSKDDWELIYPPGAKLEQID